MFSVHLSLLTSWLCRWHLLCAKVATLNSSSLDLCRFLVTLQHRGFHSLEYLPHTWLLFLQVDLQRKVEERNRLLAEYKVMEALPWGFGGFLALGMGLLLPQHLDSPGKELQEPGGFVENCRDQKFFAFPHSFLQIFYCRGFWWWLLSVQHLCR